jgi:ribose-phosphate pyrophosphokinase
VKLADRYARALDLPVGTVHKVRRTSLEVSVRTLVGDVFARAPVLVDDMISTGGTIEAAAASLLAAVCAPAITVVASHALLVGPAVERLRALPLQRLITTDSVPLAPDLPLPVQVVSLAPLLADAISRLHTDQSLADLLTHQ